MFVTIDNPDLLLTDRLQAGDGILKQSFVVFPVNINAAGYLQSGTGGETILDLSIYLLIVSSFNTCCLHANLTKQVIDNTTTLFNRKPG